MYKTLIDYIRESFIKGLKKPQIEASLLQSGWTKGQIEDAFERIEYSQKEFIEKHRRRILPSKSLIKIFVVFLLFSLFIYKYFLYIDVPNKCFVKILPSWIELSNSNIKRSIKILKYGSPEDYRDFCSHVDTINPGIAIISCKRFAAGCFTGDKEHPKTIVVATSKDLIAGTIVVIVHETCHSIQFAENRSFSEEECYAVGDRLMEKIIEI